MGLCQASVSKRRVGSPRECGPLKVRVTKAVLKVMKAEPRGRCKSNSHSNELPSWPLSITSMDDLLSSLKKFFACVHIRESAAQLLGFTH
jgi:hypothetical protein